MTDPDGTLRLGPGEPWRRLLAMVGFGFVAYWVFLFVLLLAVAQFAFQIFAGEPNGRLRHLARHVTAWLREILAFILYETDYLPFPFRPFPAPGGETEDGASGDGGPWRACLEHLLDHPLDAGPGAPVPVRAAVRDGREEALAFLGVRTWTRAGEAYLAVALRNPPMNSVFLGTPWHGRAWGAALRRAPGARTARVRLADGDNPRHVVLVPLALVLGG